MQSEALDALRIWLMNSLILFQTHAKDKLNFQEENIYSVTRILILQDNLINF